MTARIPPAWRWGALGLLATLALPSSLPAQTAPPPELGQILKDADRNRDGRLDREEFHRLAVDAFFFRDGDRNGHLVIAEVRELQEDFRGADRDGDGVLTIEEIHIYVRAARR
jgi:Ca2+-binding EF-hand superfamily protein